MRKVSFVSLLAPSVAGLTSHPAYAEAADDRTDIIVTASRAITEARETGSSISFIGRDDLQGTGPDIGKSMLVAGLCPVFTNRGLRV